MNAAGDEVATITDQWSSGLTEEFEEFYFKEPIEGSAIRIRLKGTTAGKWNTIREVSLFCLCCRHRA